MMVNLHIADLLAAFVNTTHTIHWADKLTAVEVHPLLQLEKHDDENGESKKENEKGKRGFWSRLLHRKKSTTTIASRSSRGSSGGTTAAAATTMANASLRDHEKLLLLSNQDSEEDLMYQLYTMWPLPPRDFLFYRRFQVYHDNHSVLIHYHTIEDPRFPLKAGTLRTSAPYTNWIFQTREAFCGEDGKSMRTNQDMITGQRERLCSIPVENSSKATYISLESYVEMEDIGLAWLVNYVQR
eukprot:gene7138-7891_t